MLRIVSCVIVAMATLCISDLARAQEDYSRAGWYLGLGGVVAIPVDSEDEFLGLDTRGGYRGQWGGGELQFEWDEDSDVNYDWALTLNGKLYFLAGLEDVLPPVARRFQPFATAGFGILHFDRRFRTNATRSDTKNWDFAIRAGLGLDVYLTRNIAISVNGTYVLPTDKTLTGLDYGLIGWGLLYRF